MLRQPFAGHALGLEDLVGGHLYCSQFKVRRSGIGFPSLPIRIDLTAFDLMRRRKSVDPWDEPDRPIAIGGIFVAERLQHHLLFSPNAPEIEKSNGQKSSAADDPIGKQKRLAYGPEPE